LFKLLSSGMVYVEISLASPSAVGLNAVAPLVVVGQWWFCPVGCRCAVVVLSYLMLTKGPLSCTVANNEQTFTSFHHNIWRAHLPGYGSR